MLSNSLRYSSLIIIRGKPNLEKDLCCLPSYLISSNNVNTQLVLYLRISELYTQPLNQKLICIFNKYLLSVCSMLSLILGVGDSELGKSYLIT